MFVERPAHLRRTRRTATWTTTSAPTIDWSAKYYFQNDPTGAPFAVSQTLGFPQQLKAGSQVFSLDNTTIVSPNATWEQRFGFIRQIANASTGQPFGPSGLAGLSSARWRAFPRRLDRQRGHRRGGSRGRRGSGSRRQCAEDRTFHELCKCGHGPESLGRFDKIQLGARAAYHLIWCDV